MIEQDAEILWNRSIAPGVFLMALRSPEVVAAAGPGQFVMVRVSRRFDPLLRRPFSIAGVRGDDQFLLLYRVIGRGTGIMAEKEEGERLSILGPLGRGFEITGAEEVAILAAGGMGVAPLFFLAQTLKSRKAHFLMGFGGSRDVINPDEMGLGEIEVSVATEDGTCGRTGLVTDLLETSLLRHGSERATVSIFACGPLPMLKEVAKMTLNEHLPCQVSLETSMACGLGACQGCAAKASSSEERVFYHVCQDGPVFPVRAIDWSSLQ